MAKKRSAPQTRQRKTKDDRPPIDHGDDELSARLPPDLRKEIEGLQQYERKILAALKDDKMSDLFLRNPGAVLAGLKIPISPLLRKRLQPDESTQDLLKPRSFRLPNGQVITPKVRIHFTPQEKKEDPRDGRQ